MSRILAACRTYPTVGQIGHFVFNFRCATQNLQQQNRKWSKDSRTSAVIFQVRQTARVATMGFPFTSDSDLCE